MSSAHVELLMRGDAAGIETVMEGLEGLSIERSRGVARMIDVVTIFVLKGPRSQLLSQLIELRRRLGSQVGFVELRNLEGASLELVQADHDSLSKLLV
jgi:hypothetical protein